jgi:hypothetical protein
MKHTMQNRKMWRDYSCCFKETLERVQDVVSVGPAYVAVGQADRVFGPVAETVGLIREPQGELVARNGALGIVTLKVNVPSSRISPNGFRRSNP